MSWTLVYTMQARKESEKLSRAGLKDNAIALLGLLSVDPFQTPPRYETLVGDLSGAYSRRSNIQHRLVYQVIEKQKWFIRLEGTSAMMTGTINS